MVLVPLPPAVAWAIDRAVDGHPEGPILRIRSAAGRTETPRRAGSSTSLPSPFGSPELCGQLASPEEPLGLCKQVSERQHGIVPTTPRARIRSTSRGTTPAHAVFRRAETQRLSKQRAASEHDRIAAEQELHAKERRRLSIGALMLLVAVAGGMISYLLYSQSSVGYPALDSSEGGIVLYAPKSAPADFDLWDVSDGDTSAQLIYLNWSAENTEAIHFLLEFRGGARSSQYSLSQGMETTDAPVDVEVRRGDWTDTVIFTVYPERAGGDTLLVSLGMAAPIVARAKARLLVSVPALAPVFLCEDPLLGPQHVHFHEGFWTDGDYCTYGAGESGVRVSIPIDGYGALRTDFASVNPTLVDDSVVRWDLQYDISPDYRSIWSQVRASFTDVSAEALGQRLLFWAGIVGGLAGGMLVLGIELIFLEKRLKRLSVQAPQ